MSSSASQVNLSINGEDIIHVLKFFVENGASSRAARSSKELRSIQDRVNALFALDYDISIIPNEQGQYCSSYPLDLVVLEREKKPLGGQYARPSEKVNNPTELQRLFFESRFSRCHGRFVIPTILCRGKNIARSSTLAIQAESILHKTREFISGLWGTRSPPPTPTSASASASSSSASSSMLGMEDQRGSDEELMRQLKIKYIFDLMVELRKKKLGLQITSSEKVEAHRYPEYCINATPYPGCEFFKIYRDNHYRGDSVVFDWAQSFVNATLSLHIDVDPHVTLPKWAPSAAAAPAASPKASPGLPPACLTATSTSTSASSSGASGSTNVRINGALSVMAEWSQYKSWDLVTLTRNYTMLLVAMLSDPMRAGMLIHCVSGWDRTPLFISLLRLSLWADGAIHRSLTAMQMLYLTLAYDWLLFSHQLTDRLAKGEDVMYFCFDFLKFITDPDFSLQAHLSRVHRQHCGDFDSSVTAAAGPTFAASSSSSSSSAAPPSSSSSSSAASSVGSLSSESSSIPNSPQTAQRAPPQRQRLPAVERKEAKEAQEEEEDAQVAVHDSYFQADEDALERELGQTDREALSAGLLSGRQSWRRKSKAQQRATRSGSREEGGGGGAGPADVPPRPASTPIDVPSSSSSSSSRVAVAEEPSSLIRRSSSLSRVGSWELIADIAAGAQTAPATDFVEAKFATTITSSSDTAASTSAATAAAATSYDITVTASSSTSFLLPVPGDADAASVRVESPGPSRRCSYEPHPSSAEGRGAGAGAAAPSGVTTKEWPFTFASPPLTVTVPADIAAAAGPVDAWRLEDPLNELPPSASAASSSSSSTSASADAASTCSTTHSCSSSAAAAAEGESGMSPTTLSRVAVSVIAITPCEAAESSSSASVQPPTAAATTTTTTATAADPLSAAKEPAELLSEEKKFEVAPSPSASHTDDDLQDDQTPNPDRPARLLSLRVHFFRAYAKAILIDRKQPIPAHLHEILRTEGKEPATVEVHAEEQGRRFSSSATELFTSEGKDLLLERSVRRPAAAAAAAAVPAMPIVSEPSMAEMAPITTMSMRARMEEQELQEHATTSEDDSSSSSAAQQAIAQPVVAQPLAAAAASTKSSIFGWLPFR